MSLSFATQISELLAQTEPFDSLSEEDRLVLRQKITLEIYAPGEVILNQGDDIHRALYVVVEGLVRLSEAGTGRTVDMVGAGSQFGSYGLLQGGALPYEAQAVEESSCALIAAESFQRLLDSNEVFRAYFEAETKRYVRTLNEDIDASGAFLLFDTTLGSVLRAEAPTVAADATAREAAQNAGEKDGVRLSQMKDGCDNPIVKAIYQNLQNYLLGDGPAHAMGWPGLRMRCAAQAARSGGSPSRMRRAMFSSTTIASSTSSPIATASPPRVITLIESSVPVSCPIRRNTTIVITSESGMAVRVMNVVRKLSRNRNSTTTTRAAPMANASPTL